NHSHVRLKGEVFLENGVFGGIEVSNGAGTHTDTSSSLTLEGTLSNSSETIDLPTIWTVDKDGYTTDLNNLDHLTKYQPAGEKNEAKRYYFLVDQLLNAAEGETLAKIEEIKNLGDFEIVLDGNTITVTNDETLSNVDKANIIAKLISESSFKLNDGDLVTYENFDQVLAFVTKFLDNLNNQRTFARTASTEEIAVALVDELGNDVVYNVAFAVEEPTTEDPTVPLDPSKPLTPLTPATPADEEDAAKPVDKDVTETPEVKDDAKVESNTPDTGIVNISYIYVAMILVSGLLLFTLRLKKRFN
ncbi:MAG: hypothetical protein GX074_02215, partial [Erysipelothrix sp.]|nr:hypothetical protein [Erysipelothrix sp.]